MRIETKSYHNNKKVPVVVVEVDDGWWYVCEFQFSEPETGVNTQKVFQLSSFCSVSVTTGNSIQKVRWLMFSNLRSYVRPSCLQATRASLKSHKSLHTVPHCPRTHTSTRPSKLFPPPASRISVPLQAVDEVRQRKQKEHHRIR